MNEHTTPWTIKDGVAIWDAKDRKIALAYFDLWTSPDEARANAAHIVRCVNSHGALMAVSRAYVTDYEDTFIDPSEMTGESKEIYDMAKAALALAAEPVLPAEGEK